MMCFHWWWLFGFAGVVLLAFPWMVDWWRRWR